MQNHAKSPKPIETAITLACLAELVAIGLQTTGAGHPSPYGGILKYGSNTTASTATASTAKALTSQFAL